MASSLTRIAIKTGLIVGLSLVVAKYVGNYLMVMGLIKETSAIDGFAYYVRPGPYKSEAADMLARLRTALMKLYDAIVKSDPSQELFKTGVATLKRRYPSADSIRLFELNSLRCKEIAYNQNKNDGIFLCLRSDLNTMQLADFETLVFIAIHEMAHSMQSQLAGMIDGITKHDAEFEALNEFLILEAMNLKLVSSFRLTPRMHCGAMIGVSK